MSVARAVRAVTHYAALCRAVPRCVTPCRTVPHCAVSRRDCLQGTLSLATYMFHYEYTKAVTKCSSECGLRTYYTRTLDHSTTRLLNHSTTRLFDYSIIRLLDHSTYDTHVSHTPPARRGEGCEARATHAETAPVADWHFVEAPGAGEGAPIVVAEPWGPAEPWGAAPPPPSRGSRRHPGVRPEQGQPGAAGEPVWSLRVAAHPHY